ncbi:MAG: flagellar protein FlaG [Thiotrichales bacterium]|nr:flagellar protein FlaG [Thiotrichales bacterium]
MPTGISTVVKTSDSQASGRTAATPVQAKRQDLPGNAVTANSSSVDATGKQVGQVVDDLNIKLQNVRRELHFSVNKDSGRTIITVIDSETKEVIRQIPPEEVVALAEHFEQHSGLLMNAKV